MVTPQSITVVHAGLSGAFDKTIPQRSSSGTRSHQGMPCRHNTTIIYIPKIYHNLICHVLPHYLIISENPLSDMSSSWCSTSGGWHVGFHVQLVHQWVECENREVEVEQRGDLQATANHYQSLAVSGVDIVRGGAPPPPPPMTMTKITVQTGMFIGHVVQYLIN